MKDISWRKLLEKIGFLYLYFFIFAFVLFIFLKSYSRAKFSEFGLNNAMVTVSKLRDISSDPCLYSILGDPIAAGEMYAKVNIFCPENKKSKNSIDLRVIDGKTTLDLLAEVGRINGFKVTLNNNLIELGELKNRGGINTWSCYVGTRKIVDFNEMVQKSSNIDCIYGSVLSDERNTK